jgi:hypothetical protein
MQRVISGLKFCLVEEATSSTVEFQADPIEYEGKPRVKGATISMVLDR